MAIIKTLSRGFSSPNTPVLLPLLISIIAATPSRAERWAVLPDKAIEQSGLPDLLTVELSSIQGIQVVERQSIDRAFRELEISAVPGGHSLKQQLQLGKTLGAHRLMILRRRILGNAGILSAIIVDTELGVRLASVEIAEPLPKPSHQDEIPPADSTTLQVEALTHFVRETRDRFHAGIRRVLAIAPMRSLNASAYYGKFGPSFQELLFRAVSREPGVAVLELEESRQILKELDLATADSSRHELFRFVSAEYLFDTELPEDHADQVEIRMTVTASAEDRVLSSGKLTLPKAAAWLAGDAVAALVADDGDQNSPKLTPKEQFALLRDQVLELDRYAMADAAERCAAAAELIDPDDLVIGLVGYRTIEKDEALSIPDKVELKLRRAERLAEKGLINSVEFANLIGDVEERILYGQMFRPGFYEHREALARIFCDFHRRAAPLVARMDPTKIQRDVRPLFRQLLPGLKRNLLVWHTERTQALPFIYFHSVFRWMRFLPDPQRFRGPPQPLASRTPPERNPYWTLDGFKQIVLESTNDATNAELPLTLPVRGKMPLPEMGLDHKLHMGALLWWSPPICTEDELERFYDELARQPHRPVLQFYGRMGRIACQVYLAKDAKDVLADEQRVQALLAEIADLERRFAALPAPKPFDLGSPYHLAQSELKALREAIETRDSTYVPPAHRGRIHSCVKYQRDSIAELIPHPVPIRLDTSVQMEPIVALGKHVWDRWERVSDSLDLVWSPNELLAIPAPDKVVTIYDRSNRLTSKQARAAISSAAILVRNNRPGAEPGAIADVAFDGESIWRAMSGFGVCVTDTSGHPIAQWNDQRWPVDFDATRIFAYQKEKCLLVTFSEGRTTVLVLTLDAAAGTIHQKVVHEAVVRADNAATEVFAPEIAFRPLAVFRSADRPDGPVWIARDVDRAIRFEQGWWHKNNLGVSREVPCAPLRFDPASETVAVDPSRLFPRRLTGGVFVPFEDRIFLIKLGSIANKVEVATWSADSPMFQKGTVAKFDGTNVMLYEDGGIHIFGRRWSRLDPRSFSVKTIQNAPFPLFERYAFSAHYGLVATKLQSHAPTVRTLMSAAAQADPSFDDRFLSNCSFSIRKDQEGLAETRALASLSASVPPERVKKHVDAGMQLLRSKAVLGWVPKTRPQYPHQMDGRWQLELDKTWSGDPECLARLEDLGGPVSLVMSGLRDPQPAIQVLRDRPLANLCALILENVPLTDQDLAAIQCLPHLQALYLVNTQVTDEGLAALEKCPSLRILHIQGPQFTDLAVEHLAHLHELTELTISGKGFTIESLKRINQLGLPNLKRLAPLDATIDPMEAYFVERKSTGWHITHPVLPF